MLHKMAPHHLLGIRPKLVTICIKFILIIIYSLSSSSSLKSSLSSGDLMSLVQDPLEGGREDAGDDERDG